ncbi:MAG: hypothetical protein H7A25_14605 [Leptospiraceae bacterium]|nr:hypothetical protein [Leptospiraceae bacterium]
MDDKFFIDIVNTGIAIFRIGEKKFQQNIQKILEDTNSLVKVGEEEQSGQAIQIREITQKAFRDMRKLAERTNDNYRHFLYRSVTAIHEVNLGIEKVLSEQLQYLQENQAHKV